MILITHDLGLIAEYADRGNVMYAGEVVETGTVQELFTQPSHPYTQGLLRSLPRWGEAQDSLYSIPGTVPRSLEHAGCAFLDRCPHASEECREQQPVLALSGTQYARCAKASRTLGLEDCAAARSGADQEVTEIAVS